MGTINFNDTEIAEMRQFYQEELNTTLRKLQHINKVLERLGSSHQIEIKIGGGQGSSQKASFLAPNTGSFAADHLTTSKTSKSRRKKTGPKSMWEPLILKRMRQLNRPLSYDELTQEIMVFAKISSEKKASVKQAITNVIFRLRNRDKKLDTFSLGSREKYIALKSWFDEAGDLKKEYKQYLPKKTIKRKPVK